MDGQKNNTLRTNKKFTLKSLISKLYLFLKLISVDLSQQICYEKYNVKITNTRVVIFLLIIKMSLVFSSCFDLKPYVFYTQTRICMCVFVCM